MFINRISELALLHKRYASDQAEFFVLYGRRRVGKTELLQRFGEGLPDRTIFYVADLGTEASLRAGLSAAVNTVLFGPAQADAVYATWDALLSAIAQAAHSERLLVVLDEFPYLVVSHPPLASVLQRMWDQVLSKSKVMLVLCGSYIGMMEETVLGYKAPLYGRRTAQYLLEPLLFKDAKLFCPFYSHEDQVRTYAVYGGTPAYLGTIQATLTLSDNIRDGILSRGAFLYDEVRFVLQQELREPRIYFAVLQAIAAGKTRLNEIKQAVGIDGVSAYLETLQQLHLLERIVPVTETQPHKSRRGLYRLKDHFLRFWFRYVHPNRSQLERDGSQIILDTQVIPQQESFTSLAFEEVCRQFLWTAGLAGQLAFIPSQVGGWWNAHEEIDAIALGETNAMLVECKWSTRPVGTDVLTDLERKSRLVESELENRRVSYALCARSGFTPQLQQLAHERRDVLLLDLPTILASDI